MREKFPPPLAAVDVTCQACVERLVRVWCEQLPVEVGQVGCDSLGPRLGEMDDQALYVRCGCGAPPQPLLYEAARRLLAGMVEAGVESARVSVSRLGVRAV